LLGAKNPQCSLKISAVNIQVFFKIFEQVVTRFQEGKAKPNGDQEKILLAEISADIDFIKVFGYLFETMRGLLIYAKEGEFDKLFIEENIIPQLAKVIIKLYCDHSDLLLKLTSKVVNKKVIANDDQIFDLINYVIGTIKCFTQTSKEVQRVTV